ncbi:hypothetical protein GCM10017674_72800 [Streptomyces gardneri]|uniref:Sialidase domain-containing protein n=1 Tax=Streptomyces gardneri TaxID=66892 RepID=A0A4Y3RW18_9ACTN|nr:hypothetical protein SGA01_75010 [Streptomyces gardneri]GHH19682.1 hypothetical protein GCM10017674_72800 [Streptomyces gardneri]
MLLAMANGQNDVRMTLRVSRDSGRTWGPLIEVRVGNDPVLPDNPVGFPWCACRRCADRNSAGSLSLVS